MTSPRHKDTARTIRNNLKRFISISVICALGVAMFCGLRASCSDLREAADRFFDEHGLFDVQVLSTLGLDRDDIDALGDVEGVSYAEGGWSESTHTTVNGTRATVEVKALSENGLNTPYVIEGHLPEADDEVAVTQKFIDATGYTIGDSVELDEAEDEDEAVFARHPYTICAIVIDAADVNNPELSFRASSGSDYTFIVAPGAVVDTDTYTVAYLALDGTEDLACFSDEYTSAVRAVTDRIEDTVRHDREQERTARVRGDAQAELDDARAEYEQERAEAESELADGRAELDDAARQLEDAAAELTDSQAQIDGGWAEIASGEQELADGRAELADGEATGRAQLEEELARARTEAQTALDAQIEAGRQNGLLELNRRFDAARDEAQAELDAGIEAGYEQGKADIDAQIDTARDEAQAELEAQIDAGYEQGKAEIDTRFDAARSEAEAELEAQLAPLREQVQAELDERLQPAYETRDQLAPRLEQAQGAVDQANSDIAAYTEAQTAIDEVNGEIEALDPTAEGYADLLASLQEKLASWRQRMEELDARTGGLSVLNEQLEEAQRRVDKIQAQLGPVEAEIEEAEAQAAEIVETARQQGLAQIEDEIAPAYQAALDELDQTIADQREAAQAELDTKLDAEYRAALETLEQQIEEQREVAQAELDARMEQSYASSLDTLEQTIADQREAAQQTLEAELAQGRSTALGQLENELAAARAELERGAAELEDARAELVAAQAELDRGRAEYEDGVAEYQDGLAEWQDGRAEADKRFADAEAELADAQAKIDDIGAATWYVQPRSSLSSYSSISSDADSIEAIGTLFPIVFLVVAVLVSLTTITRLVEEERGLIGTYKALGYRNREIFSKYLTYALSASAIGCLAGLFLGFIALPSFIFVVFGIMYLLPGYPFLFDAAYGIGGSLIFIVAIGGTAYLACRSEVRRTPAELMRPKAPRSGSRIFLERIPFIWRRLSFLNKVTARNIFRYKRRFLMTVAGILGCTALIVCGFAIKDSVAELVPEQYERIDHYDLLAVTEADGYDAAASELASDPRVDELAPVYIDSVTIKFAGEEETVQLVVVPDDWAASSAFSTFISLTDRDSQRSIDLPDRGAVITQNAAEVLGFAAGDTLSIQDTQLDQADIEVSSIARNYLGNYVYMSATAYRAAFGEGASALSDDGSLAPNGMLATCASSEDAADLYDELTDDARYLSVTSTDELADDFSQSFMLINAVVAIVLGMAAALAFAVLFTLSTTNISERERELATIKVLGFRPREVHHYVNKETLILTGMGIVCGLPCGYVLGDMLLHILHMPQISFLTTVTPPSYALAAILPFVFALAVNLITNRTLNRIDMIEALKSVE